MNLSGSGVCWELNVKSMDKFMFNAGNGSFLRRCVPLFFSLILTACSSEDSPIPEEPLVPKEEPVHPSKAVKVVTMTADNLLSGNADSRTAFELADNKLTFAWAEKDEVGIYPSSGTQIGFTIKSGAGAQTAVFDGGAWVLSETETYAAYYPYSAANAERSNAEIPFSYEGQQQKGNASLAHLGTHDLMATNATQAANGELNFQFKHLNCVAQFNLTVPVVANFTSLRVRCDEEIFTKVANLNLSGSEYAYSASEMTNQLQMSLSEVASTEASQILTFYMMLPPLDMSGKTVYVVLQSDDNRVYQGTLPTKTMVAGKAYSLATTLVDATVSSSIISPGFGDSDTAI